MEWYWYTLAYLAAVALLTYGLQREWRRDHDLTASDAMMCILAAGTIGGAILILIGGAVERRSDGTPRILAKKLPTPTERNRQ